MEWWPRGFAGGWTEERGVGLPWAATDLSEVALGVLQSEFMDAIEMIDICR